MQLLDLLREDFILLNQRPSTKREALLLLTQALERGGVLEDSMSFFDAFGKESRREPPVLGKAWPSPTRDRRLYGDLPWRL